MTSGEPPGDELPTRMRRRGVADTTVAVTELGFGGAAIGNLYRAVDADVAEAAVHTAWRAGIRYFDTAPHYGLGLSERRLGRALAPFSRGDAVVSSKVGRILIPNDRPNGRDDAGFDVPDNYRRVLDYSRDGILRSIEDTLHRMELDRLDMVFVHDPDDFWRVAAGQAMPALAELRDQGVIGAIGAGMNQSRMLERFLTDTAADVVMLAGRYTLVEQNGLDDVLASAERLKKSVIAVGVFNSGLLARHRVSADAMYDYRPASAAVIARANAIADVCTEFGTTLPAAALAFPLGHPSVVNVTVGMQTPELVRQNVDLYEAGVPDELWPALKDEGLIREDAPVPARSTDP